MIVILVHEIDEKSVFMRRRQESRQQLRMKQHVAVEHDKAIEQMFSCEPKEYRLLVSSKRELMTNEAVCS